MLLECFWIFFEKILQEECFCKNKVLLMLEIKFQFPNRLRIMVTKQSLNIGLKSRLTNQGYGLRLRHRLSIQGHMLGLQIRIASHGKNQVYELALWLGLGLVIFGRILIEECFWKIAFRRMILEECFWKNGFRRMLLEELF